MYTDLCIEICCSNIESVKLAADANADAIELCVNLEYGGLSPSIGMIRKARTLFKKEMAVFFRPRNGNFIYTDVEKDIIYYDIQAALREGIDTVVAGGLNHSGGIDSPFMENLRALCQDKTLCFHRALDICENPNQAIETLITCKVDRILSSGRAASALIGIKQLKYWQTQYGNQIEWMAVGGIDATNAKTIIDESGLNRFHASLRSNQVTINTIMNLGDSEIADSEKIKKLFSVFNRAY